MLPGKLYKVLRIFAERVIRSFGRIGRHARTAPDCLKRLEKLVLFYVETLKQRFQRVIRLVYKAQHQMLYRNIVVLHASHLFFGIVKRRIELRRYINP